MHPLEPPDWSAAGDPGRFAGGASGGPVDWLGLSSEPLPVDEVSRWVSRPDCGAVVAFTGRVRDHADGRPGVSELQYEAYEEYAVARMADIVADARHRWADVARVAILHRVGRLSIGEAAVAVAVSSAHRDQAFEAARYLIDTVKSTVPIWKRERWAEGEAWGTDARPLTDVNRPHVRQPDASRPDAEVPR